MMKHIDADKLKEILKSQIKERKRWMKDPAKSDRQDQLWSDLNGEDMSILQIINILQQEQPGNICPRCVYRNKTDDLCEYPYGGRICRINENGVYECNGFEEIEQQEQTKVDLEKEIEKEWEKLEKDYSSSALDKSYVIVSGLVGEKQFSLITRHFYELGRQGTDFNK